MRPELSAVLVSAGTTATVGSAGAFGLWRLAAVRPAAAARAAPAVVVAALAAGVAVATRAMVVAEGDYRTVLFVLGAGAPMAALIGVLLARRVSVMAEAATRERADRLRAAQVEASRRETLGWLSHDLRTPLAGVRLLAESLQENVIDDPRCAGGRIVREVDRLNAMVDDIVELSRMHGLHAEHDDHDGSLAVAARARERVCVDDLVSDAVASVTPLADAAGIAIEPGTLCGASADLDVASVTRAVTNLVRNAVQHSASSGPVTVSTRRAGRWIDVVVDDRCGGIPVADLPRVFEPGWRGDVARNGANGADGAPGRPGDAAWHGGGLGLGLAIVAEAARAHEGMANVRNRDDGTGCTFVLRVPAASDLTPDGVMTLTR